MVTKESLDKLFEGRPTSFFQEVRESIEARIKTALAEMLEEQGEYVFQEQAGSKKIVSKKSLEEMGDFETAHIHQLLQKAENDYSKAERAGNRSAMMAARKQMQIWKRELASQSGQQV